MNNRSKLIAALGVVAALGTTGYAAASYANEGKAFGGMKARGGMMAAMERYDTDGDGKLGVEEAKTARADQFKKFDANGDGKLELKEYQALWLDAMRERMVDRFQSHDDDGDGGVTLSEFNKRFERMIAMMDRNGDGSIGTDDRGAGWHRGEKGAGFMHGDRSDRNGQCGPRN